jgi:predicted RNase H-like HicB family nuclease
MLNLQYSLVIEATEDPSFFGFYSPTLKGFTGIGHSIEDCIYKARTGMEEYLAILKDQGLSIPDPEANPTILIQNEERLVAA